MNYQVLLHLWDKYISVMYALPSSQCIYIFFGVNFYLYAYTCNAHSGDCYFAISRSKSIWSTDTIYFPTTAFSSIIAGDASTAFTLTVEVGHMAKDVRGSSIWSSWQGVSGSCCHLQRQHDDTYLMSFQCRFWHRPIYGPIYVLTLIPRPSKL